MNDLVDDVRKFVRFCKRACDCSSEKMGLEEQEMLKRTYRSLLQNSRFDPEDATTRIQKLEMHPCLLNIMADFYDSKDRETYELPRGVMNTMRFLQDHYPLPGMTDAPQWSKDIKTTNMKYDMPQDVFDEYFSYLFRVNPYCNEDMKKETILPEYKMKSIPISTYTQIQEWAKAKFPRLVTLNAILFNPTLETRVRRYISQLRHSLTQYSSFRRTPQYLVYQWYWGNIDNDDLFFCILEEETLRRAKEKLLDIMVGWLRHYLTFIGNMIIYMNDFPEALSEMNIFINEWGNLISQYVEWKLEYGSCIKNIQAPDIFTGEYTDIHVWDDLNFQFEFLFRLSYISNYSKESVSEGVVKIIKFIDSKGKF